MTCIEKLNAEKPEYINDRMPGGCLKCPHMFGYLEKPPYCESRYVLGPSVCGVCWGREIPEEGTDAE